MLLLLFFLSLLCLVPTPTRSVIYSTGGCISITFTRTTYIVLISKQQFPIHTKDMFLFGGIESRSDSGEQYLLFKLLFYKTKQKIKLNYSFKSKKKITN